MIYIVTACSRPQNLVHISATIPDDCCWVVVYDDRVKIPDDISNANFLKCENTGEWGVRAQNFALDTLDLSDNDFVLLLDDDNIIHPEWYDSIKSLIHKDYSIMVWGQIFKSGQKRIRATNSPKVGNIDTGCFMINWKYNKNIRHIPDLWEHDGEYANRCAKNGPVLTVDKYISYYNYLRIMIMPDGTII
jgi:hypothetical protein